MNTGINRIRLEFKAKSAGMDYKQTAAVLIESDWNLKEHGRNLCQSEADVLIESDWNLKFSGYFIQSDVQSRINRVRLEFKGYR